MVGCPPSSSTTLPHPPGERGSRSSASARATSSICCENITAASPAPRAAPQRKCNIIGRPQVPRLACPFPLPGMISTPLNTSLPKTKGSEAVQNLGTTTTEKLKPAEAPQAFTHLNIFWESLTSSVEWKVRFHPCTQKLSNSTHTFSSQRSPALASKAGVLPVYGTAPAGFPHPPQHRCNYSSTSVSAKRKTYPRPGWNNEKPGQKARI